MTLALLIALPFIGSLIAGVLPTNARNSESTLAGVICLAGAIYMATLFPQVMGGGVIRQEISWLPELGLNLVFRVDGFAWLFAMLVLVIGALVVLYARYYMSPADPVPRFFSFLLAFMGAMLGVVLSGNIIQLVLFWELTSLFSFLLIGYWHHLADARRGARMALVVTGTGGLFLLAGMLVLGRLAGSYDLDVVLKAGDAIRVHALYPVVLVLVLIGALTKSAQFPFHFWLPHAMAAPTPVSAYLHSATMVKLGVFLLARFWPVLSGTEQWFWMVGGAGALTLLIGSYAAMFQNDLKGLLAYSTISHLGLITLLLGLNSSLAAVAAVFHIMNHATFKASVFMAAGIIDHESGTRDIRRLNGLLKVMPITGALAMIASASMAGVPLLNGFLSKEMFFAETVFISATPWVEITLPIIATIAGMFSVAYSLRFTVDVFFGPLATDLPHKPHEPSHWMRVPVELLVLACLVVGIFPEVSIGRFLAASALPVVGGNLPEYSLAIWHGWNLPMIMSIVALAGGTVLYVLVRQRLKSGAIQHPPLIHRLNARWMFEATLVAISRIARQVSRRIGTPRLQSQLFWVLFVAVAATAAPVFGELTWGDRPRVDASPVFALLWAIGIACAIGTAWQAKFHRLASLTMLGGAGLMTCVTFVWFSAPDLALTQLTVEVVTTVLLLLGLRWLPKRVKSDGDTAPTRAKETVRRARRVRDLGLAAATGLGMSALSYAMLTRPSPQSISPFFLAKAVPEGGGTNVVNVMLVDFRGLDTMGEITVLSAVALTVYALLRRFRPPRESIEPPQQQQALAGSTANTRVSTPVSAPSAAAAADPITASETIDDDLPPDLPTDLVNPRTSPDTALGYLLVPSVLARLMLPISAVVAFHLFMRGHNEPGGGFIAGLVLSIGYILQYMVAGTQWVEVHMKLRPPKWIAVGLLFALCTGAGSLLFGYPFLTSHASHFTLPLLGEVHLPSAFFFDIGVFSAVVGSTMLILTALAHQSVRRHRRPGAPSMIPTEPRAAATANSPRAL
ncbi:monovalent cation/H+ antiporter subunit A [soil metagenome]